MRILITGSRNWVNYNTVVTAIVSAVVDHARRHPEEHALMGDVTIVHGACPTGGDAMADDFARRVTTWTVERHPADWKRYDRRAGFVRNAEMVELGADVCLAFIRNGSRGASMTATLAERAGIPTVRFAA